jgi:anti-sigma B factor antagonist
MTTPQVEVTIEESNAGGTLIALRGEIDYASIDEVRRAVENVESDSVVLDLAALDYLDSSGIRLLLDLSQTFASRDASFLVVAPEGSIAEAVLKLTGVLSLLAADPG